MSVAWEVTEDDVQLVLDAHGIEVDDDRLTEIHGSIDADKIENNVLQFTSMAAQTASMLEDIENELINSGVITGTTKHFEMMDADSYDNDEDES